MKIGRNDPCPCGSGKKYKKCCLLGSAPSDFVASSNFPHIAEKAESVRKVLEQYEFADVVKAAFCLNSWRINRSALAQALTVNMGLYSLQQSGNKRITTYEELSTFYDLIAPYTAITPSEDFIIDDYGEVFVTIHGTRYPVITGTGYLQGYAALRFAVSLMEMTGHDEQMISLLEYFRYIINATIACNKPNQQYAIKYELPSEDYWNCIKALFEMPEFNCLSQRAAEIITPYQGNIEQLHFITHEGTTYPVFNTSLILDYYRGILNTLPSIERQQHIERTLLYVLENAYNFASNEPPRALLRPGIINSVTNKVVATSRLLFASIDDGRLLIAIQQEDMLNNEPICKTIKTIRELQEKDQLHIVEGFARESNQGSYCVHVPVSMPITFAVVDCHAHSTEPSFSFEEQNQEFTCSAADMVYLLGFSEDFSEILDYIEYDINEKAQIFTFGGKSNLFFDWKSAHRHIIPGAVECNFMNIDFNDTDGYIHERFRDCLCHLPTHGIFDEPLAWRMQPAAPGFFEVQHRGCKGFGGITKELCADTHVFFAHNVSFYSIEDFENQADLTRTIVDELNEKLFTRHGLHVGKLPIVNGKTLQFLYMPWRYAQAHHSDTFMRDATKQFVFCDLFVDRDTICIRYSVSSNLLQAIETVKDRSVENTYFLELLQPLRARCQDEFIALQERLHAEEKELRTVGVFSIEQSYHYSPLSLSTVVPEYCFVEVRKEIAQKCYAAGILPKEYHGKDATGVIRTLQQTIVPVFEDHIRQLNKDQLHDMALSYYAGQQHGVIIHMKRYQAFTNLAPDIQADFERRTRTERQICRRNVETAQYLIETNLVVEHDSSAKDCAESEFQFLIAFSDWLVVLQEAADLCHNTDKDMHICIDDMYRVDTIITEEDQASLDAWVERKYSTEDYHIKGDEVDVDFAEKTCTAFHEDTGIDLKLLLDFLSYMQLGLIEDTHASEQYPNVFSVERTTIIESYIKRFAETPPPKHEIDALISFITVDASALKTVKGKSHALLPIWEREKRDNRIEVKPLVVRNDCCLFSPVSLRTLELMWRNGIMDWFLPYEIGLPKTKSSITAWKKYYEDKMVHDIVQLFVDAGFSWALPDVELIKRFPKEGYPLVLGDYDVMAYCAERHELWIIESKVLQKVASIHEDQSQQQTFFFSHEDDQKFQRRIDFANANLKKILTSFHIDDTDCKLVPYMVTNKLFGSRYKEIQFEIITYSELKGLLGRS